MNGCYWHGHQTCFPERRFAREKQARKEQHLRELGFQVRSIWECEFRQMEASDPKCRAFFAQRGNIYQAPLNTREAFFGGRTNAFSLYHSVQDGEKIEYVDFTSLYPYINKTGRYPVGHPAKILNPSLALLYSRKYFGMAKVRVVPPKNLFHPVLPARINGKLMFVLCKSCALLQTSKCTHTRAERALEGVWCTPELYKAMDMGYEVSHVMEVHHFEKSTRGLLASYVNTFLQGKQEASGWPSSDMTDEAKDAYLREYEAHEGISLDRARIEKNPGRRQVSKLMLTSLWGKFGQRGNLNQSKICDTPPDLYAIFFNERYRVVDMYVCPTNDQMLEIVYCEASALLSQEPRNTNVYVAGFTTALARLHLLEFLLKVGMRAIYVDTDSIVYRVGPGEASLPLGTYESTARVFLCHVLFVGARKDVHV